MYQTSPTAVSAAVFLFLTACGQGTPPEVTALYDRLDGVFASDGYGFVVDFRADTRAIYHLSGESCVLDAGLTSEMAQLISPDTVSMHDDGSGFAFVSAYEPHAIQFARQGTLPAPCATPTANTPMGNFDAFAAAFDAHYAFFDLYGVDWTRRVAAARDKVTPQMSDEDLFYLFAGMIAPLKDGHLSLSAEIDGRSFEAEPDSTILGRGVDARAAATGQSTQQVGQQLLESYMVSGVAKAVLSVQGTERAGGTVQFGVIDDSIGYINVLALAGYAQGGLFAGDDFGSEQADYAEANDILDDALAQFAEANVEAIIIDASINFGGMDFLAREFAARFTDQRRLAYVKRAYDAQHSGPTRVYIEPTQRASFLGPVYLMTTDSTVSAGEIMTMSLRALPNVTHIGQPTNGALSDVLPKTLPNGWSLTLSNEVYQDHTGTLWEGRGIPPDIRLDIFNEQTLVDVHPAAVAAVVARIRADLSN